MKHVMDNRQVAWVAIDWGTTHLRAWVLDERDELIAHKRSDKGMSALSPDSFEPALLELLEPFLSEGMSTDVLCCGMVGARQGWKDAGYATLPVDPRQQQGAVRVSSLDPRLRVSILPGVQQSSPADVMRGEETQIAGYLRVQPQFEGTLCLPGTHTKWVHIQAGQIQRFTTCMSGEFFSLLSEKSVLRHSLQASGWCQSRFCDAVTIAVRDPASIARQWFSLRADSLLHNTADAHTRSRLSGLLLGLEMAAVRDFWSGGQIVVIGDTALSSLYVSALDSLGQAAMVEDGADLSLSGLCAAYHSQQEHDV